MFCPRDGAAFAATVVDLGIAKARRCHGAQRLTRTGTVAGTREYVSAEQPAVAVMADSQGAPTAHSPTRNLRNTSSAPRLELPHDADRSVLTGATSSQEVERAPAQLRQAARRIRMGIDSHRQQRLGQGLRAFPAALPHLPTPADSALAYCHFSEGAIARGRRDEGCRILARLKDLPGLTLRPSRSHYETFCTSPP